MGRGDNGFLIRVMIGCGSALTINAAIMLVTETAYPTQRATATAMFSALWQGGALVFSRLDYIRDVPHRKLLGLRIPSIVQAVAPLLSMVNTVFGPESPRWLVIKGRKSPIVRFQYPQIQIAIKQDKAAEWKDLIRTRGNRRRMMVIVALAFFPQWSGNGLVAYYLNQVFHIIGITDSLPNFSVGRRPLFIISTLGMLVTFTAQTGLTARYAESHGKGVAHAVLGFIFIFYAAYDGAYSTLYVMYTVEILPYAIRAKDLSVFYFVICVTSIANLQICNPYRVRKPQFLNPLRIQIKQRTLKETAGYPKHPFYYQNTYKILGTGSSTEKRSYISYDSPRIFVDVEHISMHEGILNKYMVCCTTAGYYRSSSWIFKLEDLRKNARLSTRHIMIATPITRNNIWQLHKKKKKKCLG
ncbi:hypothetical protein M422DRAFT_253722 [Sphaerobolus stellatus SS14]|uniref:Major facilitator superfamily (MFS) profile domain-containing protein n=1 Tax=Sphaerobolus stellatus (strain SS14) TaxID=990650 RepID=A0A0C9VW62_SPHS4|nr:hypothetical protein M422DRAFT_253722 [Sphaerobolus stellatus SS14]